MSSENSPSQDIKQRLDDAVEIARNAGRILMRHLGHVADYDEKARSDLVTIADRECESIIVENLRSSFPDDAILAEEADGFDGALARRSEAETDFAWAVDPLDGTTNFVHGYPVFGVSIGLLHEGQSVAGVVYNPAREECFFGGPGLGAKLNDESIRVSPTPKLSRCLIATGFPPGRRDHLEPLLARFGRVLQATHGVRRAGSAALDLCDVAAGRLDGYYERGLSPWDVAAGQAIVTGAGGQVTASDGGRHDVFGQDTVATNGAIHEDLRALIVA